MVQSQYIIPFYLTIFIIIVKLALGIFLLYKKRNSQINETIRFDFLFAVMIMMFSLAIARSCYFIFDFYLTGFNPDLFYISPNVWIWKTGNFLSGLGIIVILYVLDKQIYNNKFKGLFSFSFLIIALIQFFYPVTDAESFAFDSLLGIGTMLLSLILPITFLSLGIRTTGELRKLSFMICFAIVLYAGISQLMNEAILDVIENFSGIEGRTFIIILVPIIKEIALLMIAYGATKFKI